MKNLCCIGSFIFLITNYINSTFLLELYNSTLIDHPYNELCLQYLLLMVISVRNYHEQFLFNLEYTTTVSTSTIKENQFKIYKSIFF